MKKITAFFMAILPFLIVLILFATGLMVKDATHIYVKTVECIEDSLVIKQDTDVAKTIKLDDNVVVIPSSASNPALYYTSDNPDILDVNNETGLGTATGFGTTNVNVKSVENPQIQANCKVTVTDDKVHEIVINNKVAASFVACDSSIQLNVSTIPSAEQVTDPSLTYSVAQGSESLVEVDATGKITTKSTTGDASIIIKNNASGVTNTHVVHIGQTVQSIYFDDPATNIITDTEYDLSKHIHTSPYDIFTSTYKASDFFTFTSDKTDVASINKEGVITFKQQADGENTPTFTASLKGTSVPPISKKIASTMEYFADVSFNKYNYSTTLTSSNINQPINSLDLNWSVYPAQTGKTTKVELNSTNPSVVAVEGKDFVIKGIGQTTLSVTVQTSEKVTKTDKCLVTILSGSTEIFTQTITTLSESYYCCLGEFINSQYINQNIELELTSGTDVATLDESRNVVNFSKAGTCVVTAKSGAKTSTLEIDCTYPSTTKTVVKVTDFDQTYQVEVGKKIQFEVGSTTITPKFTSDQLSKLTKVDDNTYITKAGSEGVWNVELTGQAKPVKLVIAENAFGVTQKNVTLWPYYTTNAKTLDVSTLITTYPSTATDASGNKINPTFTITTQPGSTAKVTGNVIEFTNPEYVDVTAQIAGKSFEYGIKSQCGLYGKFSLNDGSETIQSGHTYGDLEGGVTKTLTIDNFYLSDIDRSEEALKSKFKISAANEGTIVKDLKVEYVSGSNTLKFSFTTGSTGTDVINISNDTFNFIINVKVTNTIKSFTLYNSDGTKLDKESTAENPIKSYSNDLTLYVATEPSSASATEYTVTWNGNTITPVNNLISLKGQTWNSGDNTLVLTTKDGKVTTTYHLSLITTLGDFAIAESHKEGDKEMVYVNAGSKLSTMTIKIADGLTSPSFFKTNFKYTIDSTSTPIESRQFSISLPEATSEAPGYEKEITVTYSNGTTTINKKFTIYRDIVSKIVFPDHNNAESTDKKGMQKVHVFGNRSYYNATDKEIEGYKLPIEIYDFQGKKIEDDTKKQQAFDTLVKSIDKTGATVTYQNGYLLVKFDKDSLYTPLEIYNNEFAKGTKNQTIDVCTHWAYYNKTDPKAKNINTTYSFVVVDAVNAYVQEALIDNVGQQKSIVLQTNFGLEGATKENVPFDQALKFNGCYALYGNGYAINFDARASTTEANELSFTYVLNTRMFGCNDAKLPTLEQKTCEISSPGGEVSTYFAYNTFQNFFQVLTIWSTVDNYVKNCMFYNNKTVCMSISNEGNKTHIEECGFFRCSNVGIIFQKGAQMYLKGTLELYNFANSEMFKDIAGHDLSFLWPWAEPKFKENNMLQTGADGREYVNAYAIALLAGDVWFYQGKDAEGKDVYEVAEQGNPKAADHLAKGFDFQVPVVGGVTIWSTRNPQTEKGAPDYYDEFDKDGNVRTEKLTYLIEKLSRPL